MSRPSCDRLDFLGSSPPTRVLRHCIEALGPLDCAVLITGETGTGKGVVARALHAQSRGAAAPFVHVDCSALAPSVIESELFGHARGAFTGAARDRLGRFELADGGTLFLDEIGDLALPLQAKLLRALQDRVFERVGCAAPRRLRARILTATHRDLEAAVEAGTFRADLYYRINVVPVEVPPLRERLEDLAELITGGGFPLPDPAALEAFRRYRWPGNVRELYNQLERLAVDAVLAGHEGRSPETPRGVAPTPAGPSPSPALLTAFAPRTRATPGSGTPELERTLRAVGGNVSRAARRLGVPRTTLRRRIVRAGLTGLIPRD